MRFRGDVDRAVLADLLATHHWYPLHDINPASLIFDVGCHGGYSTWLYAHAFPDATVVGFEPDPSNYDLAFANTQTVVNTRVLMAALWHQDTDVRTTGGASNNLQVEEGGGILGRRLSGLITLARCSRRWIDFLKIDIEGHEFEVLQRAAIDDQKAWARVRTVQIDLHGPPDGALPSLESLGFTHIERLRDQVVAWR